ncbi:MAG: CesT family type III secretion system chaperone [Parachlamydiales bacterium]|nr:CesT family type III secretion system chaperone [Parachlamydiales bacterium]
MDNFENILKELSPYFGTTLHPDTKSSCTVIWQDKVTFQLELDRSQENLVAGMTIGEVAPGVYRESIFKEALKINSQQSLSHNAVFAFTTKLNQLVLFLMTPIKEIVADKLMVQLQQMIELGNHWQDALSRGQIPVRTQPENAPTNQSSGLFGMKP